MSALDDPPPPSYDEAINTTTPVTKPAWSSPQPELAWYKRQSCVFRNHYSVDSEIVLNDRTTKTCLGSPERLSNFLNEQLARPLKTRIQILGSHFGSEGMTLGKQTDFDVWIETDWLITPTLSVRTSLARTKMGPHGSQAMDESVGSCAHWIYEDYGRTKALLIEREVSSKISDILKQRIVESIRETNYGGNIEISIHAEPYKTLITRQEITSRTATRCSRLGWPMSFSVLGSRPKSDKVMDNLKEEMEEDMRTIKAFWSLGGESTDTNTEGSKSASKLHKPSQQPQSQSQSQENAKLGEIWFFSWKVPLQNAIIEMHESSKGNTRTITAKDRNDADVIGLRRHPPKKTWGSLLHW